LLQTWWFDGSALGWDLLDYEVFEPLYCIFLFTVKCIFGNVGLRLKQWTLGLVRRLFSFSAVFLAAQLMLWCPSASAQDATVVFYAHGSILTSGLPGSNRGIFYGSIFDGNRRLFKFRDGFFVKNNRILIFHLAPGPHVFSASYGKHPSKKSQVVLTLESGKNYFLRAQSESRGVVEIEWERGRLDPVSCDVARRETENAKVLQKKTVSPDVIANLSPDQAFPPCP
jgi:hypothetical protein